jgi:hypothetical protein
MKNPIRYRPRNNYALDKLEQAKWHLLRFDMLRATLANRAAVLLSSNAVVLTGTLLIVLRPEADLYGGTVMLGAIVVVGIIAVILSGVSVAYSAAALANVRPWRSVTPGPVPLGTFFDASDTTARFSYQSEFRDAFIRLTRQDTLDHALATLWGIVTGYQRRYTYIRLAIRLLFGSIAFFLLAVLVTLIASLLYRL